MESNEKSITENESLDIIRQMITTAKNEISEDGFLYLFWGYIVLASALAQYIMIKMNVENSWLPWPVMTIGGAIVSMIYGRKMSKREKAKTYIDGFIKYLWIAFGVSLFIVLFFQWKLQLNTYPMVMLVYGIGTFVSGGALKFRPLILGGIACWALAISAFFVVDFPVQLLMLGASVLFAYIIPGHLLKAKYSSQNV